ncbi:hypothetical protein JYU34_000188 [Plutella xylostella]|uniref:Zinc finger PHD-type domain-containing protein n=1 Tax=Plutella xylostella TaxID=51655 RepID=A0ABQ7R728_PLUXY|nr:hypothetical protein JYU34_000188 [Plutella xylostella]
MSADNCCIKCKDPVFEGPKCSICTSSFHYDCSGIRETKYRNLSSDKKDTWQCSSCQQKPTPTRMPAATTTSKTKDVPAGTKMPATASTLATKSKDVSSSPNIAADLKRIEVQLLKLSSLPTDINEFRNELRSFKQSMEFSNSKMEDLVRKVDTFESQFKLVDELQKQVVSLSNKVDAMEAESEQREQWSRRSNIELVNIPEKKGEDLFRIVFNIAKTCDFDLQNADIDFVTRVAAKKPIQGKPKPIVVKFLSRYRKDNFLACFRKKKFVQSSELGFDGKSVKIFANDHLTLRNKDLLRETKRLASECNYEYVWVQTWLLPGIYNEELFDSRYVVYRTDRPYERLSVGRGGGVLLAARSSLRTRAAPLPDPRSLPDIELTGLVLEYSDIEC